MTKNEQTIGDERFIRAVENHRNLWDLQDKSYHNKILRKRTWCEIAELLGTNAVTVRARWRRLRATYTGQLKKKLLLSPLDNSHEKWKNFKLMSFLEHCTQIVVEDDDDAVISDEDTKVDLLPEDTNDSNDQLNTAEEENSDTERLNICITSTTQDSKQKKTNLKRKALRNDPLALVQKVKHCQAGQRSNHHDDHDENYLFLMSFHQPMLGMPERKRMWFRLKMQELLYKCTTGLETTTT